MSSPGKEVFLKLEEKADLEKEFADSLEMSNFVSYLILSSEMMKEGDNDINAEWDKCLSELASLMKRQERDKITDQIKDLEEKGLSDQVKSLLEKFNNLTKK